MTFTSHRSSEETWREFLAWWSEKHPGKPLPQRHNLRALTGLSDEFLTAKLGPLGQRKSRPVKDGSESIVK
jgi:hypothetical protein